MLWWVGLSALLLSSVLAQTCTDTNCASCLPHKLDFCLACNSSFKLEDGSCVASCSSGFEEFTDANASVRCLKTFHISKPRRLFYSVRCYLRDVH